MHDTRVSPFLCLFLRDENQLLVGEVITGMTHLDGLESSGPIDYQKPLDSHGLPRVS